MPQTTQKPPCDCTHCQRSRRWKAIKVSGNVQDLCTFGDELMNHICDIEQDLNYKDCILDGSWPTAREYALRILRLATEHDGLVEAI